MRTPTTIFTFIYISALCLSVLAESVVQVKSNQPGAKVYLDDKPTGEKTDLNGKAYVQIKTKGFHKFSLVKGARNTSPKVVAVKEGWNNQPVILNFPKTSTALVITSDAIDAKVRLDDIYGGRIGADGTLSLKCSPGKHKLALLVGNSSPLQREINVKKGERKTVALNIASKGTAKQKTSDDRKTQTDEGAETDLTRDLSPGTKAEGGATSDDSHFKLLTYENAVLLLVAVVLLALVSVVAWLIIRVIRNLHPIQNITARLVLGTQRRFGHFKIKRVLGRGGIATVYKAWNERESRMSALKILHDDLCGDSGVVAKFVQEGPLLKAVSDPRIVACHSFGRCREQNNKPFIELELVEKAERLDEILDREGILPVSKSITILAELCHALALLHERTIIHCDITPENVMVWDKADELRVKLIDLGVGKAAAQPSRSETGEVFGKLCYMSPEQWRGEEIEDGRTDIYSLGVMLYRMLSGDVPLGSNESDPGIIMDMHLSDPVPPILSYEAPENLKRLTYKMLEKDLDQRPTASQILKIIERTMSEVRLET